MCSATCDTPLPPQDAPVGYGEGMDTTTITLTLHDMGRLRVALKMLAQIATAHQYRRTYTEANDLYDLLMDAEYPPSPLWSEDEAKVRA